METIAERDARRARTNELTEILIGDAYRIHRKLGHGHKEKVYENSLVVASKKNILEPRQQVEYRVYFDEEDVGEYIADLVMNDLFLVEAKSLSALTDSHKGQCLSYLQASGLRLCLLINFGTPELQIKRIVLNF